MQPVEADRRQRPDARRGGTLEIHYVVELLDHRLARVAVVQFELADARVDCLRVDDCGYLQQGQLGGAWEQDVLDHGCLLERLSCLVTAPSRYRRVSNFC